MTESHQTLSAKKQIAIAVAIVLLIALIASMIGLTTKNAVDNGAKLDSTPANTAAKDNKEAR